MPGHSPLFPPGEPRNAPPRSARDLIAVLYREVGLIALCTFVGTAASLVLYMRQPRIYTSSAKVWVQTEQQGSPSFLSGIAAYRETPYPDPVNRKIETEIELMLTRTNAQAVVEKYAIGDNQLVHGGVGKPRGEANAASAAAMARDSRSKTVDLFLDGVSVEPMRSKTADTSSNVLEVKFECTDPALAPLALQSFLDNYLQLGAQQNRRLGETTSRLIETKQLNRLERARELAQERFVELQRKLDQIDLYLRLNPPEADSRVIIDAPDYPTASEGKKKKIVALFGPLAGLLLAGLRELGGERMRSPREAEWALGAPVLGAIPTLCAQARNTFLGPPSGTPNAAPTELA